MTETMEHDRFTKAPTDPCKRTIMSSTMCTIGHSTHRLDAFLDLLDHYKLEAVADVRRFPTSRRHPQYAHAALNASLAERSITYRWLPALGGRRRPLPDSPNRAWRNVSFRGYADHLTSAEFADGLEALVSLSDRLRATLMCAEGVWWPCHRALIADVLRVRGIEAVHILGAQDTVDHPFLTIERRGGICLMVNLLARRDNKYLRCVFKEIQLRPGKRYPPS